MICEPAVHILILSLGQLVSDLQLDGLDLLSQSEVVIELCLDLALARELHEEKVQVVD